MTGITNITDEIINVAITGVGGQGVLTLAEILAKAAMEEGYDVRVGEIHGMAQRGGHVVCTVRIGKSVKGPIIDPGTAHLMIGFEPVETLREIQLVRTGASVVMNSHVQYPVAVSMGKASYPESEVITSALHEFTRNIIEFDALGLAEKAGSSRSMNIVMLGAIIASGITPISKDAALKIVRSSFPGKYEQVNVKAFELGFEAIKK
jgi:indolepyruvate ferredoxin oxidoreductase beta subunit